MKKLLLSFALLPLALSAQLHQAPVAPMKGSVKGLTAPSDIAPKSSVVNTRGGMLGANKTEGNPFIQLGTTTYDLQTNASSPHRVQLYNNGQVSVVWTFSNEKTSTFSDRGTAYVHFNGTDWTLPNTSRLEPNRAGWPELVPYTKNGTQREMIISHYASGDSVTGGLYFLTNSSVGDPNFTKLYEKDKPNGPLWPRAVATGNLIHVVANYSTVITGSDTNYQAKNGVKIPTVYYRYNADKDSFEANGITLPGYDSTTVYSGSGDNYSIDAKDSVVAIAIGGLFENLYLWKSMDYGRTWTMRTVQRLPVSPRALRNGDPFYDTTYTNIGDVNVLIDNNFNTHIFFPVVKIWNQDTTDNQFNYSAVSEIAHWSEDDTTLRVVGYMPIINGTQADANALNQNYTSTGPARYNGGFSMANQPAASVDKDNNIYMTYSTLNVTDQDPNGAYLRDIYVVYSKDGGSSWSPPQTISGGEPGWEDVFPSVARTSDNFLHVSWMRDELAGVYLTDLNNSYQTVNKMMYTAVPLSAILNDSLGLYDTDVKNASGNNVFKVESAYPNPTENKVYITMNMYRSANTNITITDIAGKPVAETSYAMMPAGNNTLTLDMSNLAKGVYMCRINAGGYMTTEKVIVK
jgi:hypothetical protein